MSYCKENGHSDILTEVSGSFKHNYQQGLFHYRQGDVVQAVTHFQKALELMPNDASVHHNLGVLFYKDGRIKDAESSFLQAVTLDPYYLDANYGLVKVYSQQSRYEEAKKRMKSCLAHYPGTRQIRKVLTDINKKALQSKKILKIWIIAYSDVESNEERKKRWGDYWFKHELENMLRALGHTIIPHSPDILIHLFGAPVKNMPDDFYKILWIHSHPDWITPGLLEQYDKIYCLSPFFIDNIQALGFEAELLVGATSKKPVDADIRYDVTFVGNAKGKYGRRIIRDLGDLDAFPHDLKVWGEGWGEIIPEKCMAGLYYPNDDLETLYASSKISLNDHHDDMRISGFINPRIFDVLASGGFVISDSNPAIDEVFGDAVPQYHSCEHLLHLIDHYVRHPDERRKWIEKAKPIALQYNHRKLCDRFIGHITTTHKEKSHRQTKANKQPRRRVFYIDLFLNTNSNFYWLDAFREVADVRVFDIRDDRQTLKQRIIDFAPHHIHLGGSVKNHSVSPKLLHHLKAMMNCTVSAFYGDAVYSEYHAELAGVIDKFFISNKTHIRWNQNKGLHNCEYMICPTTEDLVNPPPSQQYYDLLFVGNNNNPSRLGLLQRLHDRFDLVVAGQGWNGTGLKEHCSVFGKEMAALCRQAKIVLGLIGQDWIKLEACFSNRLVNTLAAGSFCIYQYTPGSERVFQDKKHLVWFRSEKELLDLIEYFLSHEEERRRIAHQGQQEVLKKYTYSRAVERIFEQVSCNTPQPDDKPYIPQVRSSVLKNVGENSSVDSSLKNGLDGNWKIALNKGKSDGRFSMAWYRKHPITRELLGSDVLHGMVLDIGSGTGERAFIAYEKAGCKIVGVEGSELAVQMASNRFALDDVAFCAGDVTVMPFPDGTFQNAYMLAVIEHIPDTEGLLREIQRVLVPKGKLFLSVTENDFHTSPDHVHVFSKEMIQRIFSKHNIISCFVKEHIIFLTVELA